MKRFATWFAAVYFVLMTISVTYPGIRPFNSIEPTVLGFPFVTSWLVLWIVGAAGVFYLVHRTHSKSE